MPDIFARRIRCRLVRPTYRAMMIAGLLSSSLAGIAAAETPAAPPLALPEPDAARMRADKDGQLIAGVDEEVQRAIRNATRVVGIETSYLMVVAQRESSFDPRKHARQTTATGLYQFTAGTWLRLVRAFGARHGLGAYAEHIVLDRSGAVSMPDGALCSKLLRLRADPQVSALMAAELARDNQMRLMHILGREVTPAEVYMAHLLGVTQAARVIETAHSAPHTAGVQLLPTAARTNPGVFNPRGRVASAGAIVSTIKSSYQRQELRFVQRSAKTGTAPTPATTRRSDILADSSAHVAASGNLSIGATLISAGGLEMGLVRSFDQQTPPRPTLLGTSSVAPSINPLSLQSAL